MARADLTDGGLMLLGLSSAAAPDADIAELIAACAARGLSTLELRAGDAHGVGDAAEWALTAVPKYRAAAAAGVTIAGFRAVSSDDSRTLARLSAALDVPIIVADECDIEERIRRARSIIAEGGRALVMGRGPAAEWHDAVGASGLELAWEVDASQTDLTADADLVLRAKEPALRYIRFIGGGPESTLHEGRGIGSLMGRLALAAYRGAVILAPSSDRYHVAWGSWLGRRGGWGCGSKGADMTLVSLPARPAAGGSQ